MFSGFLDFFFCCWGVLGLRGSGGPVGVFEMMLSALGLLPHKILREIPEKKSTEIDLGKSPLPTRAPASFAGSGFRRRGFANGFSHSEEVKQKQNRSNGTLKKLNSRKQKKRKK